MHVCTHVCNTVYNSMVLDTDILCEPKYFQWKKCAKLMDWNSHTGGGIVHDKHICLTSTTHMLGAAS